MPEHPDHAAAMAHLRAVDPAMRAVVDRIGPLEAKWPRMSPFEALVRSIIYQQITTAAASTIHRRLVALMPGDMPTPESVLALGDEELRGAGLSRQKTAYLRSLAASVQDGTVSLDRLPEMDDEAVIEALTRVKGIGRWSAEIFLMSVLERPDVLASADIGLLAATQKAYGLEKRPTPREFLELGEPWRPWRTVACLYLWRSLR
jgi:DNA-3-methyladenine glycosylase II